MSVFPRRNSKTQSSLNFLQSGPRKFSKSDFSGLAPIRRVLIVQFFEGAVGSAPAKKSCITVAGVAHIRGGRELSSLRTPFALAALPVHLGQLAG